MSPVEVRQPREQRMHTPLPWVIAPHSDRDEVINVVAGYREEVTDGRAVKVAHWIAELDAPLDFGSDVEQELATLNANAKLIVRACNSYYDVIALLQDCESYFDDKADVIDGSEGAPIANREMSLLSQIRAVLAQVQG